MKRSNYFFLFSILMAMFFSCAVQPGGNGTSGSSPEQQEQEIDAALNSEISKVMAVYARALTSDDPAVAGEFKRVLEEFDRTYGSDISSQFAGQFHSEIEMSTRADTTYPALKDMPFKTDGAVYISGGAASFGDKVVNFIQPKNSKSANFFHAAILDLDKFDPSNLEAQALQSAITKGAGYETAAAWMKRANVAVLEPVKSLDGDALNKAQEAMDYFCDPKNTRMQFGFFEDYTNIFSVVSKANDYYWYGPKVVWRIYDQLGIDLDTNTPEIDWETSGLFTLVSAYYNYMYLLEPFKARMKIKEYMDNTKKTLVLAGDLYYSPHLKKVFEAIRDPQ